jgi:D-3-phosphoglycerate dehydrogenase
MIAALESGKVKRYVTDFPTKPMANAKNVIVIPHLGASTEESEDNCAVMAVKEIINFLENGNIRNSVNYPALEVARTGDSRVCVLHKNIPAMLTAISAAIAEQGINIEGMVNRSRKDYAYTILDLIGHPSADTVKAIEAIDGVIRVRVI